MSRAQRRELERDLRRAQVLARNPKLRTAAYRADARLVLGPQQADELTMFVLSALEDIQRGAGNEQDLSNLAVAANLSMLLVERGFGDADVLEVVKAGQDAVFAMQQRFARSGKVGATGQDLQALRALADVHDQQLRLGVSKQDMRESFAEMQRRARAGEVLEAASC